MALCGLRPLHPAIITWLRPIPHQLAGDLLCPARAVPAVGPFQVTGQAPHHRDVSAGLTLALRETSGPAHLSRHLLREKTLPELSYPGGSCRRKGEGGEEKTEGQGGGGKGRGSVGERRAESGKGEERGGQRPRPSKAGQAQQARQGAAWTPDSGLGL